MTGLSARPLLADRAELEARIGRVVRKDRLDLEALLRAIDRRARAGRPVTVLERKLASRLADAEALVAKRRAVRYTLDYPDTLPISAARREILEALASHRVIIVCGDTGSGKTTQLPKLCLEAGRSITGTIGHTQPRRIAARAAAARLAEELGVELGGPVGYQVRFTDETDPASLVKVMTDGILLTEIRHDRWLDAYDTIIIDEAHERSLNVDFLLGFLKRIERRRPDLKVVITSATIEPERFAEHFGGAPIVRVEGRTYPVEIRYRPPERDADVPQAVAAAVAELDKVDLAALGGGSARDMLVLLPGERWIRDAERELKASGSKGCEILPLYARLTAARQQRIFAPGPAPRIVLATNVAETSLTVPRIRFVVDAGLARISRYSTRHRLQALGVEPIAKANAVQRAGRCGRLAPGICVRLYSEEDFEKRRDFIEPEILRTNLAGVVLKLESLDLGGVDEFPFIDPPPTKAVNDAYRLLHWLGALDAEGRLTPDGEVMGRLPLDPRLARLLLAAHRLGALREGLVLAAALGVVDPREQPADNVGAARQRHAELNDDRSDFTTLLNLWKTYRRERRRGEKSLRRWCESRFLSLARLREWEDVHHQLKELVRGLGWRAHARDASYEAVHRAVLAAFVDFVAEKSDAGGYEGMHHARATIFPGSGLAQRRPRWIVTAERVATERVYLRMVAQVKPAWVLDAASHLVRRDYEEPHWDRRRGRVIAREVVTLHGLTLSRDRHVDFARVDRDEARRIFIRCALAEDDLGARIPCIERNRALRDRVLSWEAKRRTRDLYAGERAVEAFYAARLPRDVFDRASLRRWCRSEANARRLEMQVLDIATRDPAELDAAAYPDTLDVAGHALPLEYRFEPASERDGITLAVPLPLVPALRPEALEWLVPGWLAPKVLAMLRGLPKDLRRALVPLPDTVVEMLPELERRRAALPLTAAVRDALAARGVDVGAALDAVPVPGEYLMRVEILDADGAIVGAGRDIVALQHRFVSERGEAPPPEQGGWSRRGIARWDFGDLPDAVPVRRYGTELMLYPALLDVDGRVDLDLIPPGPTASARHRLGVRRLIVKQLPQQADLVRRRVLDDPELLLSFHGIGTGEELVDDLLLAAVEEAFELEPAIRDAATFDARVRDGRGAFVGAAERLAALARDVLAEYRRLARRLERPSPAMPEGAVEDLDAQLRALVHPGFLAETPPRWRPHLLRYLKAAAMRVEKLAQRAPKDAEHQAAVQEAARRLDEWRRRQPPGWPWPDAIVDYRWLLEELRVSLFAQSLGTSRPVSGKRLEEAWRRAAA
ncbi:MAG TPA: ATP-dependent RNA helicase HrpA [Gammaproteobacteria bacterium]